MARSGLDSDAAVAGAYGPDRIERLGEIRRDAEARGIRGVPSLVSEDGAWHWGTGGVERLLSGRPLVPRA